MSPSLKSARTIFQAKKGLSDKSSGIDIVKIRAKKYSISCIHFELPQYFPPKQKFKSVTFGPNIFLKFQHLCLIFL